MVKKKQEVTNFPIRQLHPKGSVRTIYTRNWKMFDAATAFICNKEKFLVANSQPHLLNLIQPKGGYNRSIKSLLPVNH